MTDMRFEADGSARWAGMGDFRLISPDGNHTVEIRYAGEPPHGDSYHRVTIDERTFPGFAWGCMFAFSPCSRYTAFSWMAALYERKTVVVDIEHSRYTVLPRYIQDFVFRWPELLGVGNPQGATCVVDASAHWHRY